MFNEDAKKNMYLGISYQAIMLIVGFILRKYIVDYLGVYNLGVMGVFENAMAMLNLLDFGIGSACMYYLYKAFAKNNKEQVAAIYSFFRKTYRFVALAIVVIGITILLNIHLIIDIENNKKFLQLVFALFLLKTALNHLLICPRTCLQCDGKRYISTLADMASMIVFVFIKIYFLKTTGSITIYLVLLTVEMLISVAYIYYRFLKEYKDYDFKNAQADAKQGKDIVDYSKSLAVSNINFFIYSSTDNIVLSKVCGTLIVGYMSNYYLIVNAIKGFVTQIINSIEANLIKSYNKDNIDKKEQYYLSVFFCFCIGSLCSICLYNLTDSFIKIFFGNEFVMDKQIILFMSIALLISLFRTPSSTVVISKKMVNREIPFTITMMITNLITSIVLAYVIGPSGVLLGTIFSEAILFIGDEFLALRSDLNLNKEAIVKKIVYVLVIIIEYYVSSRLMINVSSIFDWMINLIICIIIFVIFTLLFCKTKEFKDLMKYLFNIGIKRSKN